MEEIILAMEQELINIENNIDKKKKLIKEYNDLSMPSKQAPFIFTSLDINFLIHLENHKDELKRLLNNLKTLLKRKEN
jgi:hypothetical protein